MLPSSPPPSAAMAPKAPVPKRTTSATKSTKPSYRISKQPTTTTAHTHLHSSPSPPPHAPHKRVWKACERCRMKKTKCDGEFPCKRCKDDGQICAAGMRKKTEFKQLPRGYAEVVDHAHLSASAGILKLFDMVQKGERWDYGDPGCNDRGQPIIHNILEMLGCIRPNHDIDLPVHSAFPQDEKDLADLAAQLKARQRSETAAPSPATTAERPISSVEDPTGFEVAKFEKMVFGQRADSTGNLSPTSLSRDSFDTFSSTGNPSPTSLSCDSSNSFSLASTTPPVPMGMRNNIPLSGRGPPSGNFTNSPLFPPPAFTQGLAVGDLTFNTSWGLMDPPGSMVSPYTNYSLFEDVLTDDLMVGDNYA